DGRPAAVRHARPAAALRLPGAVRVPGDDRPAAAVRPGTVPDAAAVRPGTAPDAAAVRRAAAPGLLHRAPHARAARPSALLPGRGAAGRRPLPASLPVPAAEPGRLLPAARR